MALYFCQLKKSDFEKIIPRKINKIEVSILSWTTVTKVTSTSSVVLHRQNLDITKYELIKKITWNIFNLQFGGEKIFLPVLPLTGETCEMNFEQQTKTQIFYFQELWWYVVLFLWGGNIYNGLQNAFRVAIGWKLLFHLLLYSIVYK